VALALVLVVGTGLMATTTLRLLDVDEGFDMRDRLTFGYSIPTSNALADDPTVFHEALIERLETLPAVVSATFGCPPLRGHCIVTRVDGIRGAPPIPPGEGLEIGVRMVDEEHFEKLGIPVVAGRGFTRNDGEDAVPSIIVNEWAARAMFGDADPIGRMVDTGIGGDDKEEFAEVVGVVGDVLYSPPDRGMMAEAYYSYREYPETYGNITVRTVDDPLLAVPAMREVLTALDPTVAMARVETMESLSAGSFGDRRATLWQLAQFAAVTVLLAATGTWGVGSYSVADRRRELGLRLALGAGAGRVRRGVVRQGIRAAVGGLVVGIVLARFASRLVESLLWGVDAGDVRVYAAAVVLLFTVGALAGWVPARRATRVDPVEALRAE
jgi:predicted permease